MQRREVACSYFNRFGRQVTGKDLCLRQVGLQGSGNTTRTAGRVKNSQGGSLAVPGGGARLPGWVEIKTGGGARLPGWVGIKTGRLAVPGGDLAEDPADKLFGLGAGDEYALLNGDF